MKILVGSIFIGLLVGGFTGALWCTLLESKIEKIAIVCILILGFASFSYFGMRADLKSFNNGYCVRCGTKYQPISYERGQTYYECPNCYYGVWH